MREEGEGERREIITAAGQRADVYLAGLLPSFSRGRIQTLLRDGNILVNGQKVKAGKKLAAGDEVICRLPPPAALILTPQPMTLDIVYEDSDLIVINKPQGLVVHPAPGSEENTLVHGLLAHCGDLSGINGVLRPGIVHRLDKDTSGLLVAAKNDQAHRALAAQLESRSMKRQYIALVWGVIQEPAGIVEAPLGRDPRDRQRMAPRADGKEAATAYRVLDRLAGQTVVLCDLRTGRTHQIRAHLRFLGYPVAGDPKYGRRKEPGHWPGQALHAWRLCFSHPATGAAMVFQVPPPAYFLAALREKGAVNTLALFQAD
ncbi:MAG: RluA family pseudouridine synthase [Peptococcaceae bacterium]|jgi:23S rRNA pseudouridine1911/1915/1917 synthase|nr:RluA family pseudouridine synthase [Peptococcaceae bacterium]